MAHRNEAGLIALDWGTSVCRAYLLDTAGNVLSERRQPSGIMTPAAFADGEERRYESDFERTFSRLCADWLHAEPDVPVIACGMVGSNHGWAEAGYRHVPVDLLDATAGFTTVETSTGVTVHIIPGLRIDAGMHDVMRGEETQIVGALAGASNAGPVPDTQERVVLLPGTHSKWVRVRGTTVLDFVTYLTGEIYAWMTTVSTVARLARRPEAADWQAFDRGLSAAAPDAPGHGLTNLVFSARSLVMSGLLAPGQVHDYVSGLLIGYELEHVARPWAAPGAAPVLVCGDEHLSARYIRGMDRLGLTARFAGSRCAPAGMWWVAVASGLVATSAERSGAMGAALGGAATEGARNERD